MPTPALGWLLWPRPPAWRMSALAGEWLVISSPGSLEIGDSKGSLIKTVAVLQCGRAFAWLSASIAQPSIGTMGWEILSRKKAANISSHPVCTYRYLSSFKRHWASEEKESWNALVSLINFAIAQMNRMCQLFPCPCLPPRGAVRFPLCVSPQMHIPAPPLSPIEKSCMYSLQNCVLHCWRINPNLDWNCDGDKGLNLPLSPFYTPFSSKCYLFRKMEHASPISL